MPDFKIIPIPASVAHHIRTTMQDRYGHSLEVTQSEEDHNNPCRLCLEDTHKGDEQILFSYSPFAENDDPYAEVGPIYIHKECAGPYQEVHTFPPDIRARPWLTVRGYNADHAIHTAQLTKGEEIELAIGDVFSDPEVSYIHVRHGTYGCYLMRIERVN
ncbi:DUF1203 domain-containing protein [Fodinibius halophilus]|uniref:DUF1203 domain-containing protein n=1 Tax=Fodinibius halophilus TaxID=1736908 RepID=A0A6M1T561_9BACT|nr:DUF1203 domain-containing protein [Fodinibius halophilus]NGP87081.1 DUF1203 domain-containing protein [Fodinibius halophilus]